MKRATLDALLAAAAAKRAVVLATDLATGEERLVDPFGAAGEDAEVAAAAREAASRDEARRVERAGGAVFLRPFNPPVRVVIVGAVHVSQALARMVQLAGHEVVVVDPRRAFATAERFPGVRVVAAWPDEAFAAEGGLDRRTAVVTLTHDPKIDDPALAAALRSEAFYVGALGSKKTHAARLARLRAEGFDEAALARIHAPVGMPIGAVSPGEIAASVVAQVIGALRRPQA